MNTSTWDLSILYSSPQDVQIEKDIVTLEKLVKSFATKFNTDNKKYLTDENALHEALTEYEKIVANENGIAKHRSQPRETQTGRARRPAHKHTKVTTDHT